MLEEQGGRNLKILKYEMFNIGFALLASIFFVIMYYVYKKKIFVSDSATIIVIYFFSYVGHVLYFMLINSNRLTIKEAISIHNISVYILLFLTFSISHLLFDRNTFDNGITAIALFELILQEIFKLKL